MIKEIFKSNVLSSRKFYKLFGISKCIYLTRNCTSLQKIFEANYSSGLWYPLESYRKRNEFSTECLLDSKQCLLSFI